MIAPVLSTLSRRTAHTSIVVRLRPIYKVYLKEKVVQKSFNDVERCEEIFPDYLYALIMVMDNLFNCTAYGRLGRCCRYSFYSTNIIAVGTCFAAIGVGIWIVAAKRAFSALFEPTLYVSVGYILLVVGLLSVVASIIGCYATNKEIRCLMCTYSVAAIILFVMLLLGGIMGFVFQQQLKRSAVDLQILTALQNLYGQPNHNAVTNAIDLIQQQFHCCGVNNDKENYMIWQTSKWHMDYKGEPKKQVPESCCVYKDNNYVDLEACQLTDLKHANGTVLYMEGCYDQFKKDLLQAATVAGCFGIAASVSLVPPALFALLLAKLIQK